MKTYIVQIRTVPSAATDPRDISKVRWTQPGRIGECSHTDMVAHLSSGHEVYVRGIPDVPVRVVDAVPPYLSAPGLLGLPRF